MNVNVLISKSMFSSKTDKIDNFIEVSNRVEAIYRKALDVVRRNHNDLNSKHPNTVTNADLTNDPAMIYCKNALERIKSYQNVDNELIFNVVNEHIEYMTALIGEIKVKTKLNSYEN